MPNWCSTNISIKCKNKEDATMLYNKIEEWTSSDYCKNGFGHNWLGNIVGNSGLDKLKDGDFSIRCRGELSYLDLNDNELIISTETAWTPMVQMWVKLCEKYISEYEIFYSAEECGCGLYFTNDPDLIGKYLVDSIDDEFTDKFLDGESYDLETSEDYLRKVLQKLLDTSEKNMKILLEKFEEREHGYEEVYINPWEYVPLSDLE